MVRKTVGATCYRVTTVIFALLMMTTRSASAHAADRRLQLADAPVGPYFLTVWTAPSILRTGEIHVETAIVDGDGLPNLDAFVRVAVSPRGGAGQTLKAFSRAAGKGNAIQEASFAIEQPGQYWVQVTILDAAGKSSQTGFAINVIRISTVTKIAVQALMLASILAGIWIVAEGGRVWLSDSRGLSKAIG